MVTDNKYPASCGPATTPHWGLYYLKDHYNTVAPLENSGFNLSLNVLAILITY